MHQRVHFFIVMASLVLAPLSEGVAQPSKRPDPSAESRHAMIVGTTGPAAIHSGIEVLKQGGTAIDAALAVALEQTVLAAGSWVSFAGRMTAIVYDAKEGVWSLNACYDAPREELDPLTIPRQGTPSGRTVLVPGFMAGVEALHERFGRLPFEAIFSPAIAQAEDGFVVGRGLARLMRSREQVLRRLDHTRGIFAKENGEFYAAGDLFKQPELAATLKRVAKEGAAYMYRGEWAKRFVDATRREGGKISMEDLQHYKVSWKRPMRTTFRQFEVLGLHPPNNGGPNTLLAMNLFEIADLKSVGHYTKSPEALAHALRIEEAVSWAWSPRTRPLLAKAIGKGAITAENRATKEVAHNIWNFVTSPQWNEFVENPDKVRGSEHSDAIVAVDTEGNVVAILHTINTGGWGTTGLFVDGVSIPDSGAGQQVGVLNAGPGGRISDHGPPTLVMKDGKPILASSATGSGNITATWQCLLNVLEFGMTPQEAADTPNFYGGRVEEHAFDASMIEEVRKRGVRVERAPRHRGNGLGFWVGVSIDHEAGVLRGGKTRLLDGIAAGY